MTFFRMFGKYDFHLIKKIKALDMHCASNNYYNYILAKVVTIRLHKLLKICVYTVKALCK